MKKILFLFALALTFTGCGDSDIDADAICDGEILIPFQEKKGKSWGFINLEGEIIVEPEFKKEPSFAVNGIALTRGYDKRKKKKYYRFVKINDGKVKESNQKWDLAGEFREGLAPVRKENKQVQFINENFKVVFTADAEEVAYFNDGLAAFKNKEGKWGFLNTKGKVAIKAKYDFVRSGFVDGHAIVGNEKEGELTFRIINKVGKTILNCEDKYSNVISISEDLIKVEDEGYGFIDIKGKKVIKIEDEWNMVTDFVNGYASFYEDLEWGLIDKKGEKIFNSKFETPVFVFDDRFWFKEDGEWGVKDIDGEEIFEPQFRSAITPYPFFCATSIVGDGRDDVIFIDKKGVEFGKEQYDRVAEFDYKYITNGAWNETFESDLFDPSALTGLINTWLLDKSNGASLIKALGIQQEELWNDSDKELDYSLDKDYRYYGEDSRYFSFQMYEHNYEDFSGYSASDYYPDEEYEEYLSERDYDYEYSPHYRETKDKQEDYKTLLKSLRNKRKSESYLDEYRGYDDYAIDQEDEEEIVSKYPLDAPSGIYSVDVSIVFDDYMGVSDIVKSDEIRYYYDDYDNEHPLHLNKKANVSSIEIEIELDGKGIGKSKMLAEAIAKKWKVKFTEGVTEKKKETAYKMEGKFAGGRVVIRTSGKNTMTIEIYFGEEVDEENLEVEPAVEAYRY